MASGIDNPLFPIEIGIFGEDVDAKWLVVYLFGDGCFMSFKGVCFGVLLGLSMGDIPIWPFLGCKSW